MSERIRLHLDEDVDPAVALGLRRRGVDVTTTQEVGVRRVSDTEQIQFAFSQNRTLVTHDEGFLGIAIQKNAQLVRSSLL